MNAEAWIQSWDKVGAARYAQYVQDFCGIPANVISFYGHEVNVLNAAILACKSKYLWFLTKDLDRPSLASVGRLC